MAKRSPALSPEDSTLFSIEPAAVAGETRIVPWQELEARKVDPSKLPTVGELAMLTLVETGRNTKYDRWVKKFDWVPYHEQEASIGLKSLPIAINIASKAKGSGVRAVERVMHSVTRYQVEATHSIDTLGEALLSDEDRQPIPETIRSSFTVRSELANFLLAKSSLSVFDWHPRRRSPSQPNRRHDALLQKAVEQLSNKDIINDQQLVALWHQALTSQKQRQTYWDNQQKLVKGDDRVRAALSRH